MKRYKQLTSEQRYQISGLRKAGFKQEQIADEVGVNKSTISRELRRNKGQCGWRPKQAQELRDERCQLGIASAALVVRLFVFLEPFLDGVARQTGSSLDLTDSEMFAEMHPPNLCIHDHGNHLCLLLLKY